VLSGDRAAALASSRVEAMTSAPAAADEPLQRFAQASAGGM
jgi:hypothetical protein